MKTKFSIFSKVGIVALILATFQLHSQNFTRLNSGTPNSLLGVAAPSNLICYVTGAGGTILKTIDGGGIWVPQVSGTAQTLYSTYFTSPNRGYAVGDNGAAIRTIDGGQTWTPMNVPAAGMHLRSVRFADDQGLPGVGFITGGSTNNGSTGVIYITTNSGVNWAPALSLPDNNAGFYSISFIPQTGATLQNLVVFASRYNGDVYSSSDGGTNWNRVNTGIMQSASQIYFTSATNGVIGSSNGNVFSTSDGGNNWAATPQQTPDYMNGIDFCDGTTNGYYVGGNVAQNSGTILNTTDGGANWTPVVAAGANRLYSVDFFNCCTGYAVGLNGTILKLGTAVSAPPPTICLGSSVNITAEGSSTYKWLPSTGLNKTTGATVTANPTVTTTYTVIGTDASGCVSKFEVTVTVLAKPSVTVSANVAICDGTSTVLTAGGAVSYNWSPVTGLSSITGTSVTASPSTTTIYTVVGTDANGCQNSKSVTVTVNPKPTVTVSPDIAICSGTSTTLTAAGASTYAWSPSGGLSAVVGTSVTANPAVTKTYIVTGTDTKGCKNTASVTVTVSKVTVSPDIAICIGNSTNLTAAGASTYKWSPSTGLSATVGATVTASPLVTTVYTVVGTNAQGCINQTKVTVTVNPKPTITLTSDVAICDGTSTVLTAGGATNYSWSPATGLSATIGASVTANPTVTKIYTVIGTDANGCQNSKSVTVTVNPIPAVTTSTTKTICNKTSVDIALNSTIPCNFTWKSNTNSKILVESTTPNSNPIVDVLNNTASNFQKLIYTVTATSINGACKGADVDVTVTVIPSLTISNTELVICSGEAIPQVIVNAPSNINSKFTWTVASNSQVDGETNSTAAATNITDILTNFTTNNQVVTYAVTPISVQKSCTGTPQTVNVTVKPQPVVTFLRNNETLCSGRDRFHISFQTSVPSTYSWYSEDHPNVTGESTTPQTTNTVNDILTLYNSPDVLQTVTYTVTTVSTNGGCKSEPQYAKATIFPIAVLTNELAVTVCNGSKLNIPLTANIPSDFTWQANEETPYVTGESLNPVTSNIINDQLTNSTTEYKAVRYKVLTTAQPYPHCGSLPKYIMVWVSPDNCIKSLNELTSTLNDEPENEHIEETQGTTISVAPNPFTEKTTIAYRLHKQSDVILEIMNVLGEKLETIITAVQTEGEYKYDFSAKENASGIYYVKITIDGVVTVKKIIALN